MVSAGEPRVYEGIWRAKNGARQEGWERPVLVTRARVPLTKEEGGEENCFGRCGRRGTVLNLTGIGVTVGPPGGNTGRTPRNGLG